MVPRKRAQDQSLPDYHLKQLVAEFLPTLPPEKRPRAQQELHKFIQWFGETCPVNKLTIPQVENYVQQAHPTSPGTAEKLETIRAFLSYAHKQGLTTTNLAICIKIKKTPSHTAAKASATSNSKTMLTHEGYEKLRAELESLKRERPRIAEELRRAAADKDLRENAPFEAMKEYQGHVETRIRELEAILKDAIIVNAGSKASQEISLGDIVKLKDLRTGEILTYVLVDSSEANPQEGKISTASPVGQALLGKTEGEEIEVKAPAGTLIYRIEAVLNINQEREIGNQ